ncbi:MAG: hypothetical protein KKB70_05640, partial [Proteobacteria bacterium]|nr:hypothetical protein [Pseudomonadota bacterium]
RTTMGVIRAVLSDRYLPISNWDLARISYGLMEKWNQAGKCPVKVYECDVSDTSMHLKFLSETPIVLGSLKDGSPDIAYGGINITNSEVGASSYLVEPYMLRLVCENGMIAPRSIKQIHLGSKIEIGVYKADTMQSINTTFALEFRDIFDSVMSPETSFFKDFTASIIRSKAVMMRDFGNVKDVATQISKNMDLHDAEIDKVLALIDFGDQTMRPDDLGSQWALGNAITAVANCIPNMERKIELQRAGFEVLTKAPEILLKVRA